MSDILYAKCLLNNNNNNREKQSLLPGEGGLERGGRNLEFFFISIAIIQLIIIYLYYF